MSRERKRVYQDPQENLKTFKDTLEIGVNNDTIPFTKFQIIQSYIKNNDFSGIIPGSKDNNIYKRVKNILRPFKTYVDSGSYRSNDDIDIREYKKCFEKALDAVNAELNKTTRPSTAESIGSNGGAAGNMKYNGRTYKIRIGKRGGKYILVGADKKKVYV